MTESKEPIKTREYKESRVINNNCLDKQILIQKWLFKNKKTGQIKAAQIFDTFIK